MNRREFITAAGAAGTMGPHSISEQADGHLAEELPVTGASCERIQHICY